LREGDPIELTPEQFRRLLCNIITEPHRTMVIVAICLGMRRADIKTTMNVYGKAMAEPMREANSEVVRLVIQ